MHEPITEDELHNRMFYVRPDQGTIVRHQNIQEAAFEFGAALIKLCPNPSRELSLALSRVEEARMWANAAIAHRQGESG